MSPTKDASPSIGATAGTATTVDLTFSSENKPMKPTTGLLHDDELATPVAVTEQLSFLGIGGRRRKVTSVVKNVEHKTIDDGKNVEHSYHIGKTVKVAGKDIKIGVNAAGKEITTGAEALANFFTNESGEICVKAITLATDTVIIDKDTGVEAGCDEMCSEAGLETDSVGGGPEDPFADGVAAALAAGCSTGCAIAIDTYTVDAWGTDTFSKAICGYCGL